MELQQQSLKVRFGRSYDLVMTVLGCGLGLVSWESFLVGPFDGWWRFCVQAGEIGIWGHWYIVRHALFEELYARVEYMN